MVETATGHRHRLRERFSKNRLDGFHDYEVIELLLTYAIARRDVKPVAKALLRRFGSLNKVFEATRAELAEVDGIGENAATLLTLLKPVTGEYISTRPEKRARISSSKEAVVIARKNATVPGALSTLYLNTKNEVLFVEEEPEPFGADRSIKTKAIIESAIEKNAKSIIFVRTLEPGVPVPKSIGAQEADELAAVKSVEDAAVTLDIAVHDYIISSVGEGEDEGEHLSSREEGFL